MSANRKRRRWRLFTLFALALLVLVGAGLGTFYVLSNKKPAAPTNASVGQAFFISSGQLKEGSSQGINDQLEIELHSISAPAPGKSYYVWLLSDKGVSPESSNLLGRLFVENGNAQLLYRGDSQHSNLIGTMSRLLITEEDTTRTPVDPPTDQQIWRYYAELPQIRSPVGAHRRVIDTLRDLLYDASRLQPLGLHGGSDVRLLRNTEKVLEWASSASNAWQSKDLAFIHRQIVRILDYLDSASLVAQDVPVGTPLLVDPQLAQVPLIDMKANQPLLSYIDRMNNQLTGLSRQPGTTTKMLQLAKHADVALLGTLKNWLGQVRQDAKQLVQMSDGQLSQPSTLAILDDLQMYANISLIGRLDPSTDAIQGGMIQIHDDVQRLVTFDVQPYYQH